MISHSTATDKRPECILNYAPYSVNYASLNNQNWYHSPTDETGRAYSAIFSFKMRFGRAVELQTEITHWSTLFVDVRVESYRGMLPFQM
jgi:hypothetical protein